jgi:phage replication initiation protein
MENVSKRHFACSDCGQVYTSFFFCVCPHCRSGVVHQTEIDDAERHARQSYTHKQEPNKYKHRATLLHPEYILGEETKTNAQEEYLNSEIVIDDLAFTVKMAEFRHCTKSAPFSGIAFPPVPALPPIQAKSTDDIDSINGYRNKVYTDYFENCVLVFITKVLGFTVGPTTGSKFNFYDDHFCLFSKDGEEYCGKVGFGGSSQKETIHFSITGVGCKHLFSTRSRAYIHHWLANVLNVTVLTRIDLAYDDFDGIHTCKHVELAFMDDAFKRSRGISPKYKNEDEWHLDADGNKIFSCEMRKIGSRQSLVYWRIYNKAIEQKIEKDGFVWYRSEVELKRVSVDILLDIEGYFVSINQYASSLFSKNVAPKGIVHKAKKRLAADVIKSAYWLKRQWGRTVNSLLELYSGDCEKVVTTILREDSRYGFTPMHQKLVDSL